MLECVDFMKRSNAEASKRAINMRPSGYEGSGRDHLEIWLSPKKRRN